jgi:choline dehydrogenase
MANERANASKSPDYVIVGAGAAGCVLADRLSADGKHTVVLVEAGRADPEQHAEVQVPVLFARMFGSEIDWGFRTTPQEELNKRKVPIPRGKALGGSTAINAQLWTRGHQADFDGWADAGYDGWGHADLLPYFRRAEERIALSGLRYPSPSTADFLNACARLGHAPAAEQQEGYALARATHSDGLRWSSADAYLRSGGARPNLEVRTDAQVLRVLFEGTRAVGVETRTAQGTQVLRAEREVILAAGAVGSPHLLMLSGVGPADHLTDVGVPVVADAPGVGRNLTDHLLVPLAFEGRDFASPGADTGPEEIEQYLKERTGPLDSIVSEAVLFLRTRAELAAPDIEVIHLVLPFGDHESVAQHGLTLGVVLLQPESTGRVMLASADPLDAPLIDPRYLSDPDGKDLATVVAGIRAAQQILHQPEYARWRGAPLTPGALSDDSGEIAEYVRRTGESIHHLVSTCRMGPGEHDVLDTRFRVRGVSGLRVVDASALPGVVRAHTHAAVTAVAERASELIARG